MAVLLGDLHIGEGRRTRRLANAGEPAYALQGSRLKIRDLAA